VCLQIMDEQLGHLNESEKEKRNPRWIEYSNDGWNFLDMDENGLNK
jgi:hypothetical protein